MSLGCVRRASLKRRSLDREGGTNGTSKALCSEIIIFKLDSLGLIRDARTAGAQVCRLAFMKLLGVGSWRLTRTRHVFQGTDMRKYSSWAKAGQGLEPRTVACALNI